MSETNSQDQVQNPAQNPAQNQAQLQQIVDLQSQVISTKNKYDNLYNQYKKTVHIVIGFIILMLLIISYDQSKQTKE